MASGNRLGDRLMSELAQNEKNSLRANVFRSCPNSRHRQAVPALPGCARTGREQSQQTMRAVAGYSITSSARASTDCRMSRPRVLAVLMLITNSYLVGACTGRSAGFSPLRMRST